MRASEGAASSFVIAAAIARLVAFRSAGSIVRWRFRRLRFTITLGPAAIKLPEGAEEISSKSAIITVTITLQKLFKQGERARYYFSVWTKKRRN